LRPIQITEEVMRPTQRVGYIVSGRLDLWVAGKTFFTEHAGDGFRIRGETFRWMNPCRALRCDLWNPAPQLLRWCFE
jgi:hypothetical protein